jgi:hypothetical protein
MDILAYNGEGFFWAFLLFATLSQHFLSQAVAASQQVDIKYSPSSHHNIHLLNSFNLIYLQLSQI